MDLTQCKATIEQHSEGVPSILLIAVRNLVMLAEQQDRELAALRQHQRDMANELVEETRL